MKLLPLIFIILFAFTACNEINDDATVPDNATTDDAINALEDTVLNATTVSNNIVITGATKTDGNPPTPTGDLSFTTDTSEQTGFQSTGVQFKLNTSTPIAGVYLQIVSSDGTKADNYYNIPASAFGGEANNLKQNSNNFSFSKKQSKFSTITGEDTIINIDFSADVPPGTFCGEFCVYDSNGNISQPITVCVEVESWGGNSALTGSWDFVEEVYTETYNGVTETETIVPNVEHCDQDSFYCSSTQDEIDYEECDTITENGVIFNEDGTYVYTEKFNGKELDYQLSEQNCTAQYMEGTFAFESRGNWAYDEEEGKLTIIQFSFSETFNGVTESESSEDGEYVFSAVISSLTETTFIIQEEGSFEYNGEVWTYQSTMTFTKN